MALPKQHLTKYTSHRLKLQEVKLVMFQYKIVQNILPTQLSLHRNGIAESDICPLCKNERHNLIPLVRPLH